MRETLKPDMKKHTDVAWEQWGQQDPYFGVLNDQKYRSANIRKTKSDFFESGDQHIGNVIEITEKHFGPIPRASALDFGCGVGRLLVPLSKLFRRVAGVDVSKAMLQEAAKNLDQRDIGNVDLLESDDELSTLGDRQFDFVHTYIVLQHLSPERGYIIVQNLLSHLSAGGAFFIHVSCKRNLPMAREFAYFCKTRIPFAYVLVNLFRGRRVFEPKMEVNEYDVGRLLEILSQAGFQEVLTRVENHGNTLTAGFYSRSTRAPGRARI